jgi:hypothetical protein
MPALGFLLLSEPLDLLLLGRDLLFLLTEARSFFQEPDFPFLFAMTVNSFREHQSSFYPH